MKRFANSDLKNGKQGGKRPKMKFGRAQKREITRSTARGTAVSAKDSTPGQISRFEDTEAFSEEIDSDEEEQSTIASRRNQAGDSKLAYSALVTLLNSKEVEEDSDNEAAPVEEEDHEDLLGDYGGAEDSGEEKEDEDVFEGEIQSEEEEEEEEVVVNNKYDPFNSHFNKEDNITQQITEFEKQSIPLKLINREILKDIEENAEYQKFHYGYFKPPSDVKSGTTLKQKLKYYNVKQKIQKEFDEFGDDISPIDLSLIESMLTYETLNFQYYNHQDIKGKYQDFYTLHALNHIMKTSDLILGNNEKKSKISKQIEKGEINPNDEPEFRDQGYYRPKILILLPTRNIAWEVVNKLIKNSNVLNVDNKKKFQQQFYSDYKVSENSKSKRPDDFEDIFNGNSNDFFTIGLKWTRKTMKLYCKIEHCDIIIASPLGLKMLIDKTNSDFLTSIEMCIIDKMEGLIMQNWSHLYEILNKLNKPPKNFDGLKVDFSRIRMWSINDQSQFLTQILTFGKYLTPEIMTIVKKSKNLINGSTLFKSINDETVLTNCKREFIKMGLINKQINLKQTFLKFNIKSIVNEPNDRFEFFKSVLLPQIMNKLSYEFGTLLYIPNYIDYLRVIDYLEKETKVPFVSIDEYSSRSKLDRNRALFLQRSAYAKLMVYTERLHFYKRYDIKGVRNIIFYQLPTDPQFYQQILQFIGYEKVRIDSINRLKELKEEEIDDSIDLNLCSIKIAFDKLDMMKLEKIVGLNNCHELINGDNEIFELN